MSDKLKFFLFLLFAICGFLLGISGIINYFLFADFPSIVMFGFAIILFMFFPIAIWMNYVYTFVKSKKEKKNILKANNWKLIIIVNIGLLIGIILIIKGADFDTKIENQIRKNSSVENIRLLIHDIKAAKSKGKITRYTIHTTNYPALTFKLNKSIYNTHHSKLKLGENINIAILKKSYEDKIKNPNTKIPNILTLLSDRHAIEILDIQ